MNGTALSTPQVITKRVVIKHLTGLNAGLHEILGFLVGMPEVLNATTFPDSHYGPSDALKTAKHHKTHERYIEYREEPISADVQLPLS